ncbi:hypothetical protein QJ054_34095 [Streptomyces sp. AN-3]|uniref:hypothetical protein n=1 Tax=Streptomyces sp. AN-3 TaxID=3044177 RepID=UPI00249BBB12|nr:hypothetical protein [Streptomyces sp. AN-3]MDI3102070.1 hypothetical protein [Streptomyces sp. AN-3]MDV6291318.1 hypothetical protein [Streptomyces sp. UP1A-1]
MTAKQFLELQERRRRGGQVSQPAAAAPPRKTPQKKAPAHPGPPSTPPAPAVEPLLAMLSGPGRHWTLLMPYAEKMLTSNQRLHHMAKHRIRRQLRADAAGIAMAKRLPRLERAAIFYVLHPRPLSRKRDPGNWADTAKHYVDGLVVDGGLLPDDNHEFLMGPIPVMGEPVTTGFARMTLVIVELTEPVTSGNAETVTGMADPTYRR